MKNYVLLALVLPLAILSTSGSAGIVVGITHLTGNDTSGKVVITQNDNGNTIITGKAKGDTLNAVLGSGMGAVSLIYAGANCHGPQEFLGNWQMQGKHARLFNKSDTQVITETLVNSDGKSMSIRNGQTRALIACGDVDLVTVH